MKRTSPFYKGQPALLLSGLALLGSLTAFSQEPNPTSGVTPSEAREAVQQKDGIYLYRVKVVQRDLDAVNYFHRSGSTRIAFKGTTLLPNARQR